ncbi:MAG: 5-oxoprolinase subunit PxpA [Lapillicoccus sp.]
MPGPSTIDLNADVGESFGRWRLGDDEALLDIVTSANVACGFHAGDPTTLVATCRAAAARGVAIGAQVGYRDLAGFGRRFVDVAPDDLYADVLYQLSALDGLARTVGSAVTYVKPHGALYNAVVHHRAQADAVVRAVADHSPGLPVLGLPGSTFLAAATDAGLRAVPEAFADRGYTATGTLVPRSEPGALLDDPPQVAARVVRLVTEGRLTTTDGSDVEVQVESVCVHGDSPGAVALAFAVRDALAGAGVRLAAFAPPP